jgi:DNA polymerase I
MIILLDVRYLLYRSHYKMSHLATSTGIQTGALFGLCRTVRSFHDHYSKQGEVKFLLCHDCGIPAFRKSLEGYKSGRDKDPALREAIKSQEQIVQEELPLPQWVLEGFEADDLIASFCDANPDERILVISNDKDIWACVTDNVKIQKSISEPVIDIVYIGETFPGARPDFWPLIRAISGDSSDKIPGIKGYAIKKACGLIRSPESLQLFLQDPEIMAVIQRNLRIMALVKTLRDYPESRAIDNESWNEFMIKYEMVTCTVNHNIEEIQEAIDLSVDLDNYKFPGL